MDVVNRRSWISIVGMSAGVAALVLGVIWLSRLGPPADKTVRAYSRTFNTRIDDVSGISIYEDTVHKNVCYVAFTGISCVPNR